MSENSTKLNGTAQRKTLASQLDRLDGILDALDVALAEAVRDAVAGAIREAVVIVTRELLTNPDVLGAIAAAATQTQPAPTSQPVAQPAQPNHDGVLSKMRCRLGRAWNSILAALSFVAAWTLSALPSVTGWLRQTCLFVWKHRVLAGVSLAVGLAVGCLSHVSGPTLSSLALAVCGAGASAAAFVIWPFARLWAGVTGSRHGRASTT